MAEEILGLDTSQIFSAFWSSMPPEYAAKIGLMLDLSTGLLIITIVYLVLSLLIKLFSAFVSGRKLKKISLQLEQIASLLGKNKGGKQEKKESKGKKN